MYFSFLIEDKSSGILIEALMKKLVAEHPDVIYACKSFKGIGGFTPKNKTKETRTGKLLNDLATYLRGFNSSLRGIPAAVVVVVDNDDRDTEIFYQELQQLAGENDISVDHIFSIAVEEVEAWILGDREAIQQAYPHVRMQVLKNYVQDSICGTWEVLADAVYPGGLKRFKKECPTYMEVGLQKAEWAKEIGRYMIPKRNQSPSFQQFFQALEDRLS